MESKILELAEKWSNAPFDDETRDEIKKLIDSKNEKELEDRFYRSLEFGTGGLRGIIGAGTRIGHQISSMHIWIPPMNIPPSVNCSPIP